MILIVLYGFVILLNCIGVAFDMPVWYHCMCIIISGINLMVAVKLLMTTQEESYKTMNDTFDRLSKKDKKK